MTHYIKHEFLKIIVLIISVLNAIKRASKLKIMEKQEKVYTAKEFMMEFYAPISFGMADDSAEEREEEAEDIVKNYPEEVEKTMKQVAERMNQSTIGAPTEVSFDKNTFKIKYS